MYINTFDTEMKRRYGRKMYRLSLDYAFGCPNRDGSVGTGGCIFCSQGSGSFAGKGLTLSEKINSAKSRIQSKARTGCGYIAYFQSYTNTYAPVNVLKNIFTEAVNRPDIDTLSIATRPDCLPEAVLNMLEELNQIKPVWVELGLQTAKEKTAEFINRCYPLSAYDSAVKELHSRRLEVITHMIIGLPGEDVHDMLNTAKHIAEAGSEGIKIQLLHVLKNTPLERYYNEKRFDTLSLEEYANILCEIIPRLPREMTIHRFTGDGDKRELIAPMWSADKKRTLNYLNRIFHERNVEQGAQQFAGRNI